MMQYDLIIRNGSIVGDEGPIVRADLAVTDGVVAAIGPELSGSALEEVDATGLYIFPGGIDAHVHFNEPGRTEWEGWDTGSAALAAGGATMCFEMPLNASPPTLDAASFDLKLAAAQASARVDFALWGGLVPGNLDQLAELAERGVIGFKAFMANSGIDDFAAVDDLTLYEGMERAAQLRRIVAVHAESDQLTGLLARRAVAEGRLKAYDFLASRPVVAELEAIERAILFAAETGCSLHIVHVSCGRGVALVAEARSRGVDVSCETCPHYLVLTEDDLGRLGPLAKCAPPLRNHVEQEALWSYLFSGQLPMVASDHSPSPPEMKQADSFFAAWGGISGCQSTLQLLLGEGHAARMLPLKTIAAATAAFVARRFGIDRRKGRIAVGLDADFVLVDLRVSKMLQAEDLYYRHRQSPYIGRKMRGQIVRTVVRGTTVFSDGTLVGSPGHGRLIMPV